MEQSEESLKVNFFESSSPSCGRGQYCLMIKRSGGQKQKCVSTQIPRFVWDRRMKAKKQQQDLKIYPVYQEVAGIEGDILLEYFPRIFVVRHSSKDAGRLEEKEHRT